MISLLGRAVVLLGLAACATGAVTGLIAALRQSPEALRLTRALAYVFAGSMVLATGLMEAALLTHDFSVSYVAEVGSLSTPTWVTVVSLWSSLNGSILLWGLVLGLFVGAFTYVTTDKNPLQTPWALSMALLVGVFFTFLVAGVANPFAPSPEPIPADGPGPNPLLQNHVLMVIHPPFLYLGYVGMTIPFAMGCAALLAGRLDAAWVRGLRSWMLVPWGFLTVGIILGGWWSYEVLGWGGWWAWDPVENASFLPWLTATAFLHSAMVMERKEQLRGWTLSLVLATFLLTLLGTFMTRSGIFNSVHSFTESPIGPVFLAFLAVALIGSLALLAFRIDALGPVEDAVGGGITRDTAFSFNNLLFTNFTFVVLVGTVYPLLNEAITGKQISVGEPWFDRYTAPLGLLLVFLMGVGPALPWGRSASAGQLKKIGGAGLISLVVAGLCVAVGLRKVWPVATISMAAFALLLTLDAMWAPAAARAQAKGEALGAAAWAVARSARRRYGGYIVHIGVLIIAVAHASATAWQTKETLTLRQGESGQFAGMEVRYEGSAWQEQPHRRSLVANFALLGPEGLIGTVSPRLNHYKKMGTPIGTPEVRTGLTEDLYFSLVNVDPAVGLASVEVHRKPLVVWLWIGGLVMLAGTVISAWPAGRARAAAGPA
ncbi:MAG: heme lyase CcmF/NrfE family subunit [Deltaproteobacteria bacterium]|nr:heme lyase CcmF/NrfE family subunit [Deltaproteobacteria bacterium]